MTACAAPSPSTPHICSKIPEIRVYLPIKRAMASPTTITTAAITNSVTNAASRTEPRPKIAISAISKMIQSTPPGYPSSVRANDPCVSSDFRPQGEHPIRASRSVSGDASRGARRAALAASDWHAHAEQYIRDADGRDDQEAAEFFRETQQQHTKIADRAKQLMQSRLAER